MATERVSFLISEIKVLFVDLLGFLIDLLCCSWRHCARYFTSSYDRLTLALLLRLSLTPSHLRSRISVGICYCDRNEDLALVLAHAS